MSRVAANMVAVNPASWLTNFVPLTQGWGTVKTRFMLEGMWDSLKAVKADEDLLFFLRNIASGFHLVHLLPQPLIPGPIGKFALSNFVVELDEYTNLLANKKSRADRNMEQAL